MFGSFFKMAREVEKEKLIEVDVHTDTDIMVVDKGPGNPEDHREYLEDERLRRVLLVD